MAKTNDQPEPTNNQPQPGTVIGPGGSQPLVAEPTPQPIPEAAAVEPPPVPEVAPAPAEPQPETQSELSDEEVSAADGDDGDDQPVVWTASEFVAHDKSIGWYGLLAAITLVLGAGILLLTKDPISFGVVVVAGLLLGVYAGHKPRQLEYVVDSRGLSIGQKLYSYDEFKSFAVMQEGAFSSLMFLPLKRFGTALTVYYAPEDEDRLLSILTNQLPMEEHRYDAVDRLLRRIRF